jgi:hypothetical protein
MCTQADARPQLTLIALFVPETYHPVLLRRKARRLRAETGNAEWIAPIEKLERSIARTVLWSCIRPFQLLFFEPMVSAVVAREDVVGGLTSAGSVCACAYCRPYCWASCTCFSVSGHASTHLACMDGSSGEDQD